MRVWSAIAALLFSACATGRAGSVFAREVVWSEAVGPRVTVRGDVPPEELAEITAEIERFIDALEAVAFEFVEKPADRVGIVLFTREEDYRLSNAKDGRVGHFLDWGLAGVELPATVFVLGEWDNQRRAHVIHELTHRYVRYYYPDAPVWLNEGLARFYETLVVSDGRVVLGEPAKFPGSRRIMPPFAELVQMTYSEFHLEGTDKNGDDSAWAEYANYHAAWMAVHFLMTSMGPWRARLDDYLLALSKGETNAAAYTRAFAGTSAEELEKATLAQFSYDRIPSLRTPFTPVAHTTKVDARRLRPAEVDVLRAWYRSSEKGTDRTLAYADLERAIAAEPSYAEGYLWRGHLKRDDDDVAAARADYAKAEALAPASAPVLLAELDLELSGGDALDEARVAALVAKLELVASTALEHETLARGHGRLGQLEPALACATRATEADIGCAWCWRTRAEMAFALERRDVALAAMDVAIKQARWSQLAQRYVQRREEMRVAPVK